MKSAWSAIAIATVLTGIALGGIAQLRPEVDFVDTVPEHPGLQPYRHLVEELEGVRFVAIHMPARGTTDLREPTAFDALVDEQTRLLAHLQREAPGTVAYDLSARAVVAQANHMLERIATGGQPSDAAYAVPTDPARYTVARDRALSEPSLDDVVAPDGSSALFLAFLTAPDLVASRAMAQEIDDALATWNHPNLVTHDPAPTGLVWASHYTDTRNVATILQLAPWAAGAVALVLFALLRRPSDVLLSVTGLAIATIWTFGAVGWMGTPISFLTLFLVPTVMGIGIDGSLHALRGAQSDGQQIAVARLSRPIVVASLSTAAALLVLGFVQAPLFAQIGRLGALGMVLALAATYLVVLPLRQLLPSPPRRPREPRWSLLAGFARNRPATLLVLLVLLVPAAVLATQNTIVSGASDNEFPQDDPVIVRQRAIETQYGAFQRAYIVVEGDLTDPRALAALEAGTRAAQNVSLAREAGSIVDLLRADAATDEGALDLLLGAAGARGAYNLPADQREARAALERLWHDIMWQKLVPFTATRDLHLAAVAITLEPTDDRNALRQLQLELREIATSMQALAPDHEIHAAGAPLNRVAVLDATPRDLAWTIGGGTLAVMTIALLGTRGGWWRVRTAAGAGVIVAGSAAIVLGAIPVLDAVYGMTGGNTAALNMMFLLAFAITVGVGVDDWLHLAHAAQHGATQGRLARAWQDVGGSITGTTATTLAAFLVMTGAYFLQSKNLAILASTGVVSAYLLTVLVAAVLLSGRKIPSTVNSG